MSNVIVTTPEQLTQLITAALKAELAALSLALPAASNKPPRPAGEPELITAKEAAELLGNVHVRTVKRRAKAGRLTTYADTGIIRYDRAEVLALAVPIERTA